MTVRLLKLAAVMLLVASGCGKVGPPQPPIIRVPQNVTDLAASQSGYNVVLTWTNPLSYVDGNALEEINVHVIRNNVEVATAAGGAAGQPQSLGVDVSDGLGMPQTFAIRVEAVKGRLSELSNSVSILPLDVPGVVGNLQATFDQFRMRVSWQPPARNPALVEAYIVRRADKAAPVLVTDGFYDDAEIEPGKTYVYTVTAARGADGSVPGPAAPSLTAVATDKTAPEIPGGLVVEPDSVVAGRAFLMWNENMEADLAGYRVYRSERSDGGFVSRTPMPVQNGFFDDDYRPGMYYTVSAVDIYQNESGQSAPQR